MQVKMKFRRENGKATLNLDASELHTYLRELGVAEEDGKFKDGPYSDYPQIDTYSNRLSPRILLTTGPQVVDLASLFNRPLTLDQLTRLADSASDVVRTVVDHYRPIEISVVIAGKKVA
jgi:hypothetical protein